MSTSPTAFSDRVAARHIEFLNAAGQAVIATALDGTIEYWNGAAETLYGWTETEAIGQNVLDLTPSLASRDQAAEIMSVLAAGEVWSGQFDVRRRNGGAFRAVVTDLPLLGDARQLRGIVGASAAAGEPALLSDALGHVRDAAARFWPDRFDLEISPAVAAARTESLEPPLVQLLALLIVRHSAALDGGQTARLKAAPLDRATLQRFDIVGLPARAVHVTLSIRAEEDDTASTRDMLRLLRESNFASQLVALAHGRLLAASSPGVPASYHLFLPVI